MRFSSLYFGCPAYRGNTNLLTNLSDSPKTLDRIKDLLASHPSVTRAGKVASLYVGPHQLLVTAEIQPIDELSGMQVRELVDDLCQRIVEAVPRTFAVYVMPVVTAPEAPILTPFDMDYWLRRGPDFEQA